MKNIKLWTVEVINKQEDNLLQMIIEEQGVGIWKKISSLLHQHHCFRSPKQCRDRWVNYLKNKNDNSPFNDSEKASAVENFSTFGPQWSKLSELIPSRTENQIKNFINSTLRRNIRHFNKGKLVHERIHLNSIEILKISEVRDLLLLKNKVSKEWFRDKFLSQDILKQVAEIKKKKEKERYKDGEIKEFYSKYENKDNWIDHHREMSEDLTQSNPNEFFHPDFIAHQENYMWQYVNFRNIAYFDPTLTFFL
jgi:hypothetical protein